MCSVRLNLDFIARIFYPWFPLIQTRSLHPEVVSSCNIGSGGEAVLVLSREQAPWNLPRAQDLETEWSQCAQILTHQLQQLCLVTHSDQS